MQIVYVGPLASVVMTKRGRSEAGDTEHSVKRGESFEVTDEVAAALVGEVGGNCWEAVPVLVPVL